MRKLAGLLILPALVATALLATAPETAQAQQRLCIDRSHMIDTLVDQYGEQLAEVHEIKGTGLLEFHVSPEEGTWTALITDEENVSCVLATGEGLDPEKSLQLIETGLRI
jgi:hypothetical protein